MHGRSLSRLGRRRLFFAWPGTVSPRPDASRGLTIGLVLLLGLWAGCVQADRVECPWGGSCPAGTTCDNPHQSCVGLPGPTCGEITCDSGQSCDAVHEICVWPSQRYACAGRDDGTPCVYAGSGADAHCLQGLCVGPLCGDQHVDTVFGERCDDGNVASGDGCSHRCRMEAGWECTGEPSTCTPAPTRYAPGRLVLVGETHENLRDLHRTPSGVLLVATAGLGYAMKNWVSRSTDQGATWDSIALGRPGQDLAGAQLFAIDDDTIGLAGTQATNEPRDAYLKYSTDEGATFSSSWINLSHSPDLVNLKNSSTVTRLPGGEYLMVFSHTSGIWARRSTDLDDWSNTVRELLVPGPESYRPWLAPLSDRVLVLAATLNRTFEVYEYHAEGEPTLIAAARTARTNTELKHYVTENGVIYLCAVSGEPAANSIPIYLYRSFDGGMTWVDETLFQSLDEENVTSARCFMDESGVYVAYQDRETGEVWLQLPGDEVLCGNGVKEAGEACDGDDFGEQNCVREGFGGGPLSCSADCQEIRTDDCTPAEFPPDCVWAQAWYGFDVDRPYTVDPDGDGPWPPFQVFCAGMDTDRPEAFLMLDRVGPGVNYSDYQYTTPDTQVECRYQRVRFADLYGLRLDGADQRYATCYGNGEKAPAAAWGRASACAYGDYTGRMNIDLTGTPFKIDLAGGATWQTSGESDFGSWSQQQDGVIVNAEGGGYCGGTAPVVPPGLILAFQ